MSVLVCLSESDVREIDDTHRRAQQFYRFKPFQTPAEMGIVFAFRSTNIWKACQRTTRLTQLLWLWVLFFQGYLWMRCGLTNAGAREAVKLSNMFSRRSVKADVSLKSLWAGATINLSRSSLGRTSIEGCIACWVSHWCFLCVTMSPWTCTGCLGFFWCTAKPGSGSCS